MSSTHRIAVIADPHVHDTTWQIDGTGFDGAVRSWAETAGSTRVFNESVPAFRAALDRAVAAGARLVIIPGDLTDDGQRQNIAAAVAILAEYEAKHGLRAFMAPGNHDFWGMSGRGQRKQFLAADGARVMLDSAHAPETAMLGAPEALALMADLGFQPRPGDFHFETPFGTEPAFDKRMHRAVSPDGTRGFDMIDASYLIEPVAGLWLLSIDANVLTPKDGADDLTDAKQMLDPSNAGWAGVARARPYLFAWMADVAARAKAAGKVLLAFSHYPALDALAGASGEECALFPTSPLARRAPTDADKRHFAATGVRLHLSGHLHVNDTGIFRDGAAGFVNLAVPSPVGFPPGLKLLDIAGESVRARTLPLEPVAGYDRAFAAYRAELAAVGKPAPMAATAADHLAFIDAHLAGLVALRYMAREWPPEMVAFTSGARFADLAALLWPDARIEARDETPLLRLAEDWYRLRKGGDLALTVIPAPRLATYRAWVAALDAAGSVGIAASFRALLKLLGRYLTRAPTLDIVIDLATFAVEPSVDGARRA